MKKNLYLFQPNFGIEIGEKLNYYFPYSAGCVWSYVSQFEHIKENYELKDIIFRREDPEEVLKRIKDPFLCGFSIYVWNELYVLHLIQRIKEIYPNTKIVVGGPQAGSDYLKYDFIDSIVFSEGEKAFLRILTAANENKPLEMMYKGERLQNEELNYPSPYTSGIFDSLIERNPNIGWAFTFETNRGCPYACTFCDWGGLTYTKVRKFDLSRIEEEFKWTLGKDIRFMTCTDANFGIFKERDMEIVKLIKRYIDGTNVELVNLQYSKFSAENNFQIAAVLKKYSRGVTVSLQSMDETTLDAIKRKNMSINNLTQMLEYSKKYGVSAYTELILGLPEETKESFKKGVYTLFECGQHYQIYMWISQILKNSEMGSDTYKKKYGIKSVNAWDFVSFRTPEDYRDIREKNEIINQTNTMSTEDIVETYSHMTVVIELHTLGYSHFLSRYLRVVHDIPYETFYSKLIDNIQKDEYFVDKYDIFFKTVDMYFREGEFYRVDANDKRHLSGQYLLSSTFYWYSDLEGLNQIQRVILETAKLFCDIPEDIEFMHKNSIYNLSQTYPLTIKTNFDPCDFIKLDTYENFEINPSFIGHTNIENRINRYEALRKYGWLKNTFKKI